MDISKSTNEFYIEGTKKISEIRVHLFRLLPFWIAGATTAVVSAFYAKLFAQTEAAARIIYLELGYWFLAVPPLMFIVSWFLVEKYSPKANGSGIPQLMAAVEFCEKRDSELVNKLLGVRIIIIKAISSLAAVLGGGAIGREGPTLQISGSIFHLINKYWTFSVIPDRAGFLLAGAASGLASAFNTPLGGIVYVMEELAKSHLSTFRTGVLHSVIFAGIISQMIMGPYLYFGFPHLTPFEFLKIFQYIALAVVSGFIVVLFTQGLRSIVDRRAQLKSMKAKFFVSLLVSSLFGVIVVFISTRGMGSGHEVLSDMLFSNEGAKLSDLFGRFFGTLLTYANGGAGGIFAPTLSIGGTMASFVDALFNLDIGPLAVLIGMTAGLSALTHSPLTSFILVLEMTDRHKAIFPLMLAAVVGHGVSKFLVKQSFYEYVCDKILKEFLPKKDS